MYNTALLIYITLTFFFSSDYYYYENYYNHTDTQDCAPELSVQHNHMTEGTEQNSTEELKEDINVPESVDSAGVTEGGEEKNFVQNSQVIELFGFLLIFKSVIC